jgi:hypothetical protein
MHTKICFQGKKEEQRGFKGMPHAWTMIAKEVVAMSEYCGLR